MSDSRLLPTGSSPLEVAAAKACAEIEKTPVSIRELWNPDTCPANLLPWLAWSFSVDRWDDKWPEATKRAVIRDAYFIHCHKGTIGAIRRVVEPLGYLIEVREWWQLNEEPGTFRIVVGVLEQGITEEMYQELERFDGKRRGGAMGHDDIVDCCSLAYLFLASKMNIPSFSAGLLSTNLKSNNPFSNIQGG